MVEFDGGGGGGGGGGTCFPHDFVPRLTAVNIPSLAWCDPPVVHRWSFCHSPRSVGGNGRLVVATVLPTSLEKACSAARARACCTLRTAMTMVVIVVEGVRSTSVLFFLGPSFSLDILYEYYVLRTTYW